MKGSKVFLSYSTADADLARRLRKTLDARGISAWSSEELHAADQFSPAVRKAFESSAVYVVLVSDDALASAWVNFELGAALGANKDVVPVFLSERALRESGSTLRHFQGILAEGLSPRDIAERVAEKIEQVTA